MAHQPFKYQSICSKPPTKHYHQRFVVIEFLDGTWYLKEINKYGLRIQVLQRYK